MKQMNPVLKLTLAASLAAVSIIIDVVFKYAIGIPFFGLPFHAIPAIIGAIILGPFYGAMIAVVADLAGVQIAGQTFLPLFAIGAFFWGFVPGVLLHKKYSVTKLAFAVLLTHFMVTGTNTIALMHYFGREATFNWLVIRMILIPINSIILIFLVKDLYAKLAPFHEYYEFRPKSVTFKA